MNDAKRVKCPRCCGSGFTFVLPPGCNPFLMGAIRISQVATRSNCYTCHGEGTVTEGDEKVPA